MANTNANRSLENIVRRADRARSTGRWPEWRWRPTPGGVPGATGWAREVTRVAENGVFAVLIRDLDTAWGPIQHAMITTAVPPNQPTWAEKQRIKDSLFGRERTAIEVFPPRSQLVDGADAYHLWLLPAGFALPFTLSEQDA